MKAGSRKKELRQAQSNSLSLCSASGGPWRHPGYRKKWGICSGGLS